MQCRRRCKIGETLIEKNFDLAFQVIYEFNLPGSCSLMTDLLNLLFQPVKIMFGLEFFWFNFISKLLDFFLAVDIYAGVAASLAERKRGGQLTEFFRNIKGTIDDDDMDQVL